MSKLVYIVFHSNFLQLFLSRNIQHLLQKVCR
uniref:Uncharacterized protein n=1 Tax=Myoviridae sp. ctKZW4 TaxID=2826639 RepID=A0A8S5NB77_9CAUD|nr:MAG TPA: hypothetical protein [Myoviridae sp. ctKZW4]